MSSLYQKTRGKNNLTSDSEANHHHMLLNSDARWTTTYLYILDNTNNARNWWLLGAYTTVRAPSTVQSLRNSKFDLSQVAPTVLRTSRDRQLVAAIIAFRACILAEDCSPPSPSTVADKLDRRSVLLSSKLRTVRWR